MCTLSKHSNNRWLLHKECPECILYDLLFLNDAYSFLWLNPKRKNFFFWMRSIARFNGKDNKVQVHKKHFTVTLSFAINLPFRRVESRRFFRRALVSFTFFPSLGSIRIHCCDRSISLFSSVLESTCENCFSGEFPSRILEKWSRCAVDIANKWKPR